MNTNIKATISTYTWTVCFFFAQDYRTQNYPCRTVIFTSITRTVGLRHLPPPISQFPPLTFLNYFNLYAIFILKDLCNRPISRLVSGLFSFVAYFLSAGLTGKWEDIIANGTCIQKERWTCLYTLPGMCPGCLCAIFSCSPFLLVTAGMTIVYWKTWIQSQNGQKIRREEPSWQDMLWTLKIKTKP